MLGRIGLTIFPKDSRILYATVDNANSPDGEPADRLRELFAGKPPSKPTVGHEIYRTDDGGENWRRVSPEGVSIGGRSNYYGQIVVDPNDPDHVYVLSERMDESIDGGRTWRRAFRYAGDNHVLWIDPGNSRHMLLGYDYGMAVTYDAGAHWYHPDELPMAQLYAIGVDMDYPYNVYGGMQDFGSWKGPSTKKGRFPIRFEDWEHVLGGEGFYNQVDPSNSRWLYSESQFGGLTRIDQKTGRKRRIRMEKDGLRFNWNAPVLISPHNPNVIYHGAQKVLKSEFRGDSWREISPDLTSNDPKKIDGVGAVRHCTITTIAESRVEPGVLWVGTDDGRAAGRRKGVSTAGCGSLEKTRNSSTTITPSTGTASGMKRWRGMAVPFRPGCT